MKGRNWFLCYEKERESVLRRLTWLLSFAPSSHPSPPPSHSHLPPLALLTHPLQSPLHTFPIFCSAQARCFARLLAWFFRLEKETSATQDYMLHVSSIAKVILVRKNDFISRSLGDRKVMFHSKTLFLSCNKGELIPWPSKEADQMKPL